MVAGIDPALTQDIKRHFVTVGHRQVHYLRAGSGPCVVLCHGSPNSGLSELGLMNALKDRFTMIAPDTPGNGNSDPLEIENPTISDYARALEETLDVLGIDKCAVYGFHTGADIAASIAVQSPERIAQVVANGLPFFTQEERKLMLEKYLPPFEPQWDGGHLCWLWPRLNPEQIRRLFEAFDLPVLLIRGLDDRMGNERCGMDPYVDDPKVDVLLLEDAGHCPFVDQPEIFFAAVEAFFDRVQALQR